MIFLQHKLFPERFFCNNLYQTPMFIPYVSIRDDHLSNKVTIFINFIAQILSFLKDENELKDKVLFRLAVNPLFSYLRYRRLRISNFEISEGLQ